MIYDLTEEHINFIKQIAKGRTVDKITEIANKQFNMNLTTRQIKRIKDKYGIKSGVDCRFKKGQIPFNKGKKMSSEVYEKVKSTMFKKGHKNKNTKRVGTERVDVEGYVYIKVAEPDVWKLKHRVLWEEINGPIPENHKLIFADGNRQNVTLDNLVLVSSTEILIMNKNKLFCKNAELTKTGANIAKVLDRVNKRGVNAND